MANYSVQIPREIPSRFQLLPGVGFTELLGAVVGGVVGLGLWYLFSMMPPSTFRTVVRLFFAVLPPAAGFLLVTGGERSLLAALRRSSQFGRSKKNLTYETTDPGPDAVQRWWPVQTVNGGLIVRKDGRHVAALTVQPTNLSLMQGDQKRRLTESLRRTIVTLPFGVSMQWLSLDQPVDVASTIEELDMLRREASGARADGLLLYRQHIERLCRGGATEKRHFLLLAGTGSQSSDDMRHLAYEAANTLRSGGALVAPASSDELMHLLKLWSRPDETVRITPVSAESQPVEHEPQPLAELELDLELSDFTG